MESFEQIGDTTSSLNRLRADIRSRETNLGRGVTGLKELDTSSHVSSCIFTKADDTIDVLVEDFGFVGEADRIFVVATNSFLLTEGDGYVSLLVGNAISETPIGEQQILEEYITEELGGIVDIIDPPSDLRVSTV